MPAVRPATVDDADAIAQVHVRSWQVAYRGLIPDHYLDAIDWRERAALHRDGLSDSGNHVQTAVIVDGGVAGFVAWGPARDEDAAEREQEVYAMYVDPPRWRSGYGSMLLAHALGAVSDGTTVTLWVLEDNRRARGFYERHGLSADGARKLVTIGGADLPEVRYKHRRSDQLAPSER